MSVQQTNPKAKPAVAGVLVLLAVVAVVNATIIQPGRGSPQRAAVRVQASQPLPIDISEIRGRAILPQENLAAWATSTVPPLRRDPFGTRRSVAPIQVTDEVSEPVTGPEPLLCDAVLLGGSRPVTIINGKSYCVGDTVRNYQVAAIGATGAKLTSDAGPALFLSVYAGRERLGDSRIVTKTTSTVRLDTTSLVEHAKGERK